MGHALSDSIAPEFCKDVGDWNIVSLARFLDIAYNFIDHELVVILKTQGMLDREPTSDIDGVQLRTDLLQLAI
jgi:hypothetical protein